MRSVLVCWRAVRCFSRLKRDDFCPLFSICEVTKEMCHIRIRMTGRSLDEMFVMSLIVSWESLCLKRKLDFFLEVSAVDHTWHNVFTMLSDFISALLSHTQCLCANAMACCTGAEGFIADALLSCTCFGLVGWLVTGMGPSRKGCRSRSPQPQSSMYSRALRDAPWRRHGHSVDSRNMVIGGELSQQEILWIIQSILARAAKARDYPRAEEMFGRFVAKIKVADYLPVFAGSVIRITGCPYSGKSTLVCGIAKALNCELDTEKGNYWKFTSRTDRNFSLLHLCNDNFHDLDKMRRKFDALWTEAQGCWFFLLEGHLLQATAAFDTFIDTAVHISSSQRLATEIKRGTRGPVNVPVVLRHIQALTVNPIRCTLRVSANAHMDENVFLVMVVQLLASRNQNNFFGRELSTLFCGDLERQNVTVL